MLTPEGKLVKELCTSAYSFPRLQAARFLGFFFVGAEKSTGVRLQVWFSRIQQGDRLNISGDLSQYLLSGRDG
jgi:hypothetical protein